MPSEKQIEVTDPGLIRFAEWFRKNYPGPDTVIHKPDWHSPKIYRAALAAAEQAEPAPAARSGAVKVKAGDVLKEAWSEFGGNHQTVEFWQDFNEGVTFALKHLAALDPAEPEVMCVGCEGKPSLGNNPCAVCGKQAAEPATDAEPVATVYRKGNVIGQLVWTKAGDHADLPDGTKLYTRPPESRLREALEQIANSDDVDNALDPQRNKRLALAALAQGADDERA